MMVSKNCGKRRITFVNVDVVSIDTKALALNDLPAKYVVTNSGEMYAKVDGMTNQNQVDVMAAITKSSVIVSKSYSHSSDEIILTIQKNGRIKVD